MSATDALPVIVPDWPVPAGIRALSTVRGGGVSAAPWDSLNLGLHVGDDPLAVSANRARLRALLPAEPFWLEQVHGTVVADADLPADGPVRADAAVSRKPGTVLAIMTADCLPVLFAARDGSVIGAAHAGWRGLAGGVLEATLAAMRIPPGDVLAWLGPAIGPDAFEVGPDVRDAFVGANPAADAAFSPIADGKFLADLHLLARQRLEAAGCTAVSAGDYCTVIDRDRFFSYRRDGVTGRMASLVWRDDDGVKPQ